MFPHVRLAGPLAWRRRVAAGMRTIRANENYGPDAASPAAASLCVGRGPEDAVDEAQGKAVVLEYFGRPVCRR